MSTGSGTVTGPGGPSAHSTTTGNVAIYARKIQLARRMKKRRSMLKKKED
jgi:hypothetical protein